MVSQYKHDKAPFNIEYVHVCIHVLERYYSETFHDPCKWY